MAIGAMGNKGANGTNGSTSATGAGAAAAFFFLVARFLDFFMVAAIAPRTAHNKASNKIHNQMDMLKPEEPDAAEPRLPTEPDESPVLRESEFKEAEEAPLEPEEESHGVVVAATAVAALKFAPIFALRAGGAGGTSVVANAPAMPPATPAPTAAMLTPMPTFSATVKGFAALPAAQPVRRLNNTRARKVMAVNSLSLVYAQIVRVL